MTTTPPDEPTHGPSARSVLVDAWLRALAPTGFTPWPREEFEDLITRQVDAMADGMSSAPLDLAAAQRAGAQLVAASFTDAETLRASLRVLAPGLRALAEADNVPDDPSGRAALMLAAFGAGFATALRDWLFDQQEEVKLALQRATSEAERRLRRSESWFREVFVRAAVGIAISDSGGKLAQANPALADILGCVPEDLIGRSLDEFFHPEDGIDIRADYHELTGLGGRPLRRRRRLIRLDGQLVWVYLAVSVLRDADDVPTLHLTMVENVDDLHLLQDLTSHQTLHDVVTGLPNRQYLLSRLQSRLSGREPDGQVTLYQVDLDGFTAINHGLGPEQGDRLMLTVARRLDTLFAGRALVARLTGDEFAVLFDEGSSPSEVLATVSAINDQLSEPLHLPDGGVGLSATIGVAHGAVGETDPYELLRRADVTLRRAQSTGHRQWAEFDGPRDAAERRGATLAATLSGALEFGDLSVTWQPWTSLGGTGIDAVSVCVGWEHPEYGSVSHLECLGLADRTGTAVPLAAWLIGTGVKRAKAWQDQFGEHAPPIGIGLTNSQVADPDLVGTIASALESAGIPPNTLWIGVPARAMSADAGEARDNVGVLSSMGVGVVLADAGLAPVDLMLLDEWPILAVQLAEPLVRSVAAADPGTRLVRTTASMVRSLVDAGVPVAVSGLRTATEVEWWRSAGAVTATGPYFGPQLDVAAATAALLDQAARR
jgi:diguanylate cyclase (GGDEF)-like protein/PAS domain S-box-containing protein